MKKLLFLFTALLLISCQSTIEADAKYFNEVTENMVNLEYEIYDEFQHFKFREIPLFSGKYNDCESFLNDTIDEIIIKKHQNFIDDQYLFDNYMDYIEASLLVKKLHYDSLVIAYDKFQKKYENNEDFFIYAQSLWDTIR
jgi:hypothetical protein